MNLKAVLFKNQYTLTECHKTSIWRDLNTVNKMRSTAIDSSGHDPLGQYGITTEVL